MTIGENIFYGGLLRFDLSPKPAFLKLDELINKTWHTEERIVTDKNGYAEFKGFFGEYKCAVNDHIKRIKLSKNEENSFEITID